jgi:dihydrofolate reductase
MPRLRFQISMSLDGFIAGPNQSEEHPLGEGGMQLHEWVFTLAAWRERHGQPGGEVNASTGVIEQSLENVGATIMGRHMFGGRGPWGEDPWEGWWGEDPPFRMPVFILTSHAREPVTKAGGTTFNFITDGIESALAQAQAAAGGGGGGGGGGAGGGPPDRRATSSRSCSAMARGCSRTSREPSPGSTAPGSWRLPA